MHIDSRLLKPSGLNNQFNPGLNFADYIQRTQNMIIQARIDITPINQYDILRANSPYEWIPENSLSQKTKRGILLVHGLYDSPFSLMDIGQHLLGRGFRVRSLLLPGHGTVPGDLLNIQRSEWIRAIDYATADLQQEVEQIYLGAFSLGCILSIHKAITNPNMAGLILLAPALRLRRCRLAWLGYGVSRLMGSSKWYRINTQKNYTRYESFNFNAAYQTCMLAQETGALLQQKSLTTPLFMALSSTDETVNAQGVMDIFQSLSNPRNRMLLYTPHPSILTDKRIIQRNSYFPDKRIIDFSHTCLPISPDNYYYGAHGVYQDFAHYHYRIPTDADSIYQGSIRKKNLSQHGMQRLSYNPDFSNMMREIDEFLGQNLL